MRQFPAAVALPRAEEREARTLATGARVFSFAKHVAGALEMRVSEEGGVALGGQPSTFMGLAGMGDLIFTCTGDLSRNRRVGLALASGKPLTQILEELGHVAEGVGTAREVARIARNLGIDMPITEAVDAVLYRGEPASEAVERLLGRDPKVENL